ncbi:trypsin-like peptidase domain-containing protein [Pseudomonas neuropathica]|uniref:trypsin-like serine peptidase n=1 Tax=Pseudomonas neuropathica TaxID=2730425 RepID=UPI0034D7366D
MPPAIDQELVLLGQSLTFQRSPFGAMYDKLAAEHNLKLEKAGGAGARADEFKVLEQLSDAGQSVYHAAFAQAKRLGWLNELCIQLTSVGGLNAANDEAQRVLSLHLQSLVQPLIGFAGNYAMTQGGLTALRRVCRVVVEHAGGTSYGTGFLVGPQAILTAWHVISPLLDAAYNPLEGSARQLKVQFDHVGAAYEILEVKVAEQWLVAGSRCHPTELSPPLPDDFQTNPPAGFDQYLDYAGIRLSKIVGRLRGFYQLDPQHKPHISDTGTQLTLYQHPAGNKMHTAVGHGLKLWPPDHETRLHHTVNALQGSSGGLLVDASYRPVALHQCGMQVGGVSINGAIPTACIAANSGSVLGDVLELDPVWRTLDHTPILGRRGFQSAVQDCMLRDKQIIAVVQKPMTPSSKSTTLEILNAMLRDRAQYSIITFTSSEIGNDPRAFAEEVIRRAGADDPAAPALPAIGEGDTALDAWVRSILFPAFAKRLATGAVPRQLWLVIQDLDINPLAPGPMQHFLEQIYRDISEIPMLRIVLLGSKIVVPGAKQAQLCIDTITPTGRLDVIEYLEFYSTEHKLDLRTEEILRLATVIEASSPLVEDPSVDAVAWFIQNIIHPALRPL